MNLESMHQGGENNAVFSADGRWLATAEDIGVSLYDMPPRKPLGLIVAGAAVPALIVLVLGWWIYNRRFFSE